MIFILPYLIYISKAKLQLKQFLSQNMREASVICVPLKTSENLWFSVIREFSPLFPEVFLGKGVLKIQSKFAGEHPCQSAISIKLVSRDTLSQLFSEFDVFLHDNRLIFDSLQRFCKYTNYVYSVLGRFSLFFVRTFFLILLDELVYKQLTLCHQVKLKYFFLKIDE